MPKSILILLVIFCSQHASSFLWVDPKQNCTLISPDSQNYCYSPPGPMINIDSMFQWSSCGIPGTLALTFDDGPSNNTGHVSDVLKQYNMKATFFLIGRNIIGNAPIVQRIVNEGHEIGSHTQDHLDLTTLTSDQVVSQIVNWEHTFVGLNFSGPLAGGVIPNYFRSPHGEINQNTSNILINYGYTVMNWGFNIEDASGEYLSPDQLYQVYISHLGDGSLINTTAISLIIKQHDNIINTSIIFQDVADYLNRTLMSEGVRFVTLSDCMGFNIPPYRPNPRFKNDISCENGIRGTGTNKLACCSASCGVCGGANCSLNSGGATACCTTNVLSSGISCDLTVSPCVINPVSLPIPTQSSPDPYCQNGIKGIGSSTSVSACCSSVCGICGGTGCGSKLGGSASCCPSSILNSGISCNTSSAPCVIDEVLMPTPTPTSPDPYCQNGIKGTGTNHTITCCPLSCGVCGGTGCSLKPGGSKNCCPTNILTSEITCCETSAPCIVNSCPTATQTPSVTPIPQSVQTCGTGSAGLKASGLNNSVLCCPTSCGVCGGTGCSLRPGGSKNCCTENILNSGIYCSVSFAPCIVLSNTS